MPFDLRPQENVVYPMPYVETETHLLVITNQRIVQFGDAGRRELATARVNFVGRLEARPFVALAIVLFIAALPLVLSGAYFVYSVWGMEAAPLWPPPFLSPSSDDNADPNTPPPAEPIPAFADSLTDGPKEVLYTRAAGVGLLCFGALLAFVGRKVLRRRRYFVLCRGDDNQLLRLRSPDKMQQTQIMMTIQSVSGR